MIRLFAGMHFLTFLFSIAASVLIYLSGYDIYFFPVALIIATAVTIFLSRLTNKRLMKLCNLLNNEIDIHGYINGMEKLLKKQANKYARNTMLFYCFNGYYYLGDVQNLKNTLDSFDTSIFKYDEKRLYDLISYYFNVSNYCLLTGDIAGAENMLLKIKEAFKSTDHFNNNIKSLKMNYMSLNILINEEKGIYDGAEHYFQDIIALSSDLLNKVIGSYNLGKLYFLQKRYEEAIPLFHYVIDNGKDLFYVKRSYEALDKVAEELNR